MACLVLPLPSAAQPPDTGQPQFHVGGARARGKPRAHDLAIALQEANEAYATDYPAAIGRHMTNTDSHEFQDAAPAISVRENERGAQIGNGWDPQWHQPTDVFTTYSDKDFRLGLNAAQTTLAAVAKLAGAALN